MHIISVTDFPFVCSNSARKCLILPAECSPRKIAYSARNSAGRIYPSLPAAHLSALDTCFMFSCSLPRLHVFLRPAPSVRFHALFTGCTFSCPLYRLYVFLRPAPVARFPTPCMCCMFCSFFHPLHVLQCLALVASNLDLFFALFPNHFILISHIFLFDDHWKIAPFKFWWLFLVFSLIADISQVPILCHPGQRYYYGLVRRITQTER